MNNFNLNELKKIFYLLLPFPKCIVINFNLIFLTFENFYSIRVNLSILLHSPSKNYKKFES